MPSSVDPNVLPDTMPSKKKHNNEGNGPEPFRILDLPREIRDQIYRELLTPRIKRAHKSYELETAILRVNRQMHRESSKVLYEENCWVFFIINFEGFADQLKAQGCPIILGRLPFGGKPTLRLDVRVRPFIKQDAQEFIIIPMDVTQIFLNTFPDDSRAERFEVHVHAEESPLKLANHRELVLE